MSDDNVKPIVIRVSVQRDYIFDPRRVDGRTPQEIIDEFFLNFKGSHHAARDAAHVNGADKVIEIKEIDFEDLGYKLGGFSR